MRAKLPKVYRCATFVLGALALVGCGAEVSEKTSDINSVNLLPKDKVPKKPGPIIVKPPIRLKSPETLAGKNLRTPIQRGIIKMGNKKKVLKYQRFNSKFALIEGDILIPLNKIRSGFNLNSTGSATGVDVYARWPGGIIPYRVDSGLTNTSRVTDAIAHWTDKTSLKFVPRNSSHKDYVTFKSSTGCSSAVGMIGGQQYINLAPGCSTGNTIHEIGHAVGLWHEHTRNDRDTYVDIFTENIEGGKEHNFETKSDRGFTGQDIGVYDPESIMHYGSYFFSKNGRATILKKNGDPIVAQRVELKSGDLQEIKALYDGYIKGDCIRFNYNSAEVRKINGDWKIVDGSHWVFSFGNKKQEAFRSLKIIKAYRMSNSCYVGRPGPSMQYLLTTAKRGPRGNLVNNEDCIYQPYTRVRVESYSNGQKFRVVSDRSIMMDFGTKRYEAYRAYRVITDEKFNYQCFVGRPGPSSAYWKR